MTTGNTSKDNCEPVLKCAKCDQPCEVITLHWKEKEEFWGAPCWRDEYEDVSECCQAEVYEEE